MCNGWFDLNFLYLWAQNFEENINQNNLENLHKIALYTRFISFESENKIKISINVIPENEKLIEAHVSVDVSQIKMIVAEKIFSQKLISLKFENSNIIEMVQPITRLGLQYFSQANLNVDHHIRKENQKNYHWIKDKSIKYIFYQIENYTLCSKEYQTSSIEELWIGISPPLLFPSEGLWRVFLRAPRALALSASLANEALSQPISEFGASLTLVNDRASSPVMLWIAAREPEGNAPHTEGVLRLAPPLSLSLPPPSVAISRTLGWLVVDVDALAVRAWWSARTREETIHASLSPLRAPEQPQDSAPTQQGEPLGSWGWLDERASLHEVWEMPTSLHLHERLRRAMALLLPGLAACLNPRLVEPGILQVELLVPAESSPADVQGALGGSLEALGLSLKPHAPRSASRALISTTTEALTASGVLLGANSGRSLGVALVMDVRGTQTNLCAVATLYGIPGLRPIVVAQDTLQVGVASWAKGHLPNDPRVQALSSFLAGVAGHGEPSALPNEALRREGVLLYKALTVAAVEYLAQVLLAKTWLKLVLDAAQKLNPALPDWPSQALWSEDTCITLALEGWGCAPLWEGSALCTLAELGQIQSHLAEHMQQALSRGAETQAKIKVWMPCDQGARFMANAVLSDKAPLCPAQPTVPFGPTGLVGRETGRQIAPTMYGGLDHDTSWATSTLVWEPPAALEALGFVPTTVPSEPNRPWRSPLLRLVEAQLPALLSARRLHPLISHHPMPKLSIIPIPALPHSDRPHPTSPQSETRLEVLPPAFAPPPPLTIVCGARLWLADLGLGHQFRLVLRCETPTDYDLESLLFVLNKNNSVLDEHCFVFFNQKKYMNAIFMNKKSIKNQVDIEYIIDIDQLPKDVQKISIISFFYNAQSCQSFLKTSGLSFTISSTNGDTVVQLHDEDIFKKSYANVHVCDFYIHHNQWKFHVRLDPLVGTIEDHCKRFSLLF